MRISGYAAVFNSESENLGGFIETIEPGAFADSLRNDDIVLLNGHDSKQPLARVSAGNLELSEDAAGLKFSALLPDTAGARDLFRLVSDGILKSMSFGFSVAGVEGEYWTEGRNGLLMRTIRRANLMEISPVTWPAYPASSVSARSSTQTSRKAKVSPIGPARANALRLKAAMDVKLRLA